MPVSSVFNDSEGLYRTTVCCCLVCRPHYSARQMRFGSRVRASFFFLRYATEIAWEDDVQGLGIAMSTVASEKNRELLFTGNVFYKQWHLCVLFRQYFEGTTRPPKKTQILILSKKPDFSYGKN